MSDLEDRVASLERRLRQHEDYANHAEGVGGCGVIIIVLIILALAGLI